MTISTSPLCTHIQVQGPGWDTWLDSLAVKPKAIKPPLGSLDAAVRARRIAPEALIDIRRYVSDQGAYLRDGYAGGQRWCADLPDLGVIGGTVVAESLNEATGYGLRMQLEALAAAADGRSVEIIQPDDPGTLELNNAFSLGFIAAVMARWGGRVKPCILNIACGNPDPALMYILKPCVQACVNVGGYVGYHGYGPATLLNGEEWLANRGPLTLEPALRRAGVTGTIRWLYTECGWDDVASPLPSGPWKTLIHSGALTVPGAQQQLEAFVARLTELGVEAAFLWNFWAQAQGDPYDFAQGEYSDQMKTWFAGHLAAHVGQPPPPPPPPPPPALLTLNQFIVKHYNERVEYYGNKGECVQLVRAYLAEVLNFPQFPGVVGAADMWDACPEAQYEHILNTPEAVPEPGNIFVWRRAPLRTNGHTELCVAADINHALLYGQNYPLLSGAHISWRDYYGGLIGWLRPKNI